MSINTIPKINGLSFLSSNTHQNCFKNSFNYNNFTDKTIKKMLAVIENYNLLRKTLPRLLDISGYRMDYLAEHLGISKNYFYTKKSKNTFSNEEFEKIIAFIWRDEFQDILDEELMKQKMAGGKNLTGNEFRQKMGWL